MTNGAPFGPLGLALATSPHSQLVAAAEEACAIPQLVRGLFVELVATRGTRARAKTVGRRKGWGVVITAAATWTMTPMVIGAWLSRQSAKTQIGAIVVLLALTRCIKTEADAKTQMGGQIKMVTGARSTRTMLGARNREPTISAGMMSGERSGASPATRSQRQSLAVLAEVAPKKW